MFDCDHENDWFAWEITRISCNFKKLYQRQNLNRKTFSILWAKASNGKNRPQIQNMCKNSRWKVICFGKTFSAITKQGRVFGFLRLVSLTIESIFSYQATKNMENIFQIIYYAETNRV